MNYKLMIPTEEVHESTYALLMRSEEKERSLFEIAVYAIFILCAVFSMWQFAQQSVAFPLNAIHTADSNGSTSTVRHSETRS